MVSGNPRHIFPARIEVLRFDSATQRLVGVTIRKFQARQIRQHDCGSKLIAKGAKCCKRLRVQIARRANVAARGLDESLCAQTFCDELITAIT